MKAVQTIFYSVLILALLGIGGLFLATVLPIPGKIEMKIVKSGSMEPTINTGGIVIIQPQASYSMGDVVTFGEDTKTEVPTTHRIMRAYEEGGVQYFETKGDANEERDTNPVLASSVIGKVIFDVPYVGYLLDFAKQPLGFSLMIGVPAALIILYELVGIVFSVQTLLRKKKEATQVPQYEDVVRPHEVYDKAETVLDLRSHSKAKTL